MSRELPIPVKVLDGPKAIRLGCVGCGSERDATDDEVGRGEEYVATCVCGSELVWKYAQADECPGCGRLGWWQSAYDDGTCSRRCHLVVEYRRELERGR